MAKRHSRGRIKRTAQLQRVLELIRQRRMPNNWLSSLSKEMAVQSELMVQESQANTFQALIGAWKDK